ncbi:MAG: YigZ family protein [Candidatus Zixiibacteriota bacterium]|nr:MAG: YigZ family protein [candidate division Zixibacteria bacterium]
MDDDYLIIASPAKVETKVRGSRFIARTALVESAEDAESELARIRKSEHAATHNCFAYVAGVPGGQCTFRYSDDGEPSGTAGRPIYDVICGRNLSNVLLVVTRYFGGTKLGTGGLAKAYGEAARLVLEKSGVRERFVSDRLRVAVDFALYDSLTQLLKRLGAVQTTADFTDTVTLELEVRRSKSDLLKAEIQKLSRGTAKIEEIR